MTSIQLKHQKTLKKLSINKNYSSEQLGHLILHIFQLKDKLVGVTDQNDTYYDLEYLAKNLKTFRSSILTLVTYKQLSQDNMSFASEYFGIAAPDKNSKQDIIEDESIPEDILDTNKGYMGHVQSQGFFQNIFLDQEQTKVLLKTNNPKNLPRISTPYYTTVGQVNSIIIYKGLKKVCQLYFDKFDHIQQKIITMLNKVNKNKGTNNLVPKSQNQNRKNLQRRNQNNEERPITADYSFQTSNKEAILEQLRSRLQSGQIGKLEYFKLKCQYYEHPQNFITKFSESQKQQSIDDFRQQIIKSREERMRYQRVLSSFQKPSREIQNRNSQIPIIVRRNNNVIQKISTSYPISPEQQHSIHLIAQLQLKGLISESQAKFYKSLVLYDNTEAYSIFTEYFNDNIDQIELSKSLKSLKKYNNQQGRVFDYGQPQPLSKLIQKTCFSSNINLLTKLAVECDEKILAAYDSYLLNRDDALFGQTGDKIASFYRLKQDLQHLQEGRFDNKKRRISSYKPNITH